MVAHMYIDILYISLDVEALGTSPSISDMIQTGLVACNAHTHTPIHKLRINILPRPERRSSRLERVRVLEDENTQLCYAENMINSLFPHNPDPVKSKTCKYLSPMKTAELQELRTWLHNNETDEANCMKEFWSYRLDMLEATKKDAISPRDAINKISDWLKMLSGSYRKIDFVAGPAAFDWAWFSSYYHEYKDSNAYNIGFSCICLSAIRNSMAIRLGKSSTALRQYIDKYVFPNYNAHDALSDAEHQARIYVFLKRLEASNWLQLCAKLNW